MEAYFKNLNGMYPNTPRGDLISLFSLRTEGKKF